MPDRKLSLLIVMIIVLIMVHDIDHVLRGDYRSQGMAESVPLVVVAFVKYAILCLGLFFYVTGKVGPGFWAIVAGVGVVLGWLAHFSPFTEQTPQYIYNAYETPGAGTAAVASVAALMLVLVATTLYARALWARASK